MTPQQITIKYILKSRGVTEGSENQKWDIVKGEEGRRKEKRGVSIVCFTHERGRE